MVFLTEERTGKELTWSGTSASKARTNTFPAIFSLKGVIFLAFAIFFYDTSLETDRVGWTEELITIYMGTDFLVSMMQNCVVRYIREERILHKRHYENLKSYLNLISLL